MLANARRFVATAAARGIRPAERISLSAWAEKYRIVPREVSPSNPGPWRNKTMPFLAEVMDCLCPWHWCEAVTLVKPVQVGGTELGMNWMFSVAHCWAAPMLIIHPTKEIARVWLYSKLMPSLKATSALAGIVKSHKARDGESTAFFKGFPGGFWLITGANTPSDLGMHSVPYILKEEWDKWADEIEGFGDPDTLADDRQTSFHRSGMAKQLRASTPTEKKSSRIWIAFLEGDQRHFMVPCPHCGEEQTLEFFPDREGKGGLRFNKTVPYEAQYACRHCGTLIEHFEKDAMLAAGRWVAKEPLPGRQPSFHINALYSPLTTWDKIAEQYLKAKDDQTKYKVFINSVLALPWEEKGEAPDYERLLERRLDYRLREIPPGGLILTCGVDVQRDGLFYEVVAWGRDKVSWSIDIGYLEGNSSDTQSKAWCNLERVLSWQYLDAFGNRRGIDLMALDSGYNTHAVYAWVRRHHLKTRAVKGMPGWLRPAVGTPTKQEVNYAGRKISRGVDLWPVGTWQLKSELYGNLRKAHTEVGMPAGYCAFSREHDEQYFKQLTAESYKQIKRQGRHVGEWSATGANHYHDCRIYAMAAAEMLEISHLTAEKWDELQRLREMPPHQRQRELFNPVNTPPEAGYIDAKDDWLS